MLELVNLNAKAVSKRIVVMHLNEPLVYLPTLDAQLLNFLFVELRSFENLSQDFEGMWVKLLNIKLVKEMDQMLPKELRSSVLNIGSKLRFDSEYNHQSFQQQVY